MPITSSNQGPYAGDWTPALARLFPERVAIEDLDTGVALTYRDLAARVDRAAHHLFALGIRKGDRVAVLAKNRIEFFDLLFAAARLGAIFVPLNWRLKEAELAFILQDAEPALLFYEGEFGYLVGRLCARQELRALAFDELPSSLPEHDVETLAAHREPIPQVSLTLDDPWFLLYTSGTTGHPKGALLPHRQVAFNAWNTLVALDLCARDSTATFTPLFHTGALHVLTTPLLSKGGRILLMKGFDADVILEQIGAGKITVLFGVPTTFEMLSAHERFADTDFSQVRLALCGGAPCPLSLIERYQARGVVFKQGYGLTEVGPNCLNLNEADVSRKAGSAGQPNLTITARLYDESYNPATERRRGELCLAGPCVFSGYWRRPDANASAFTEEGAFRTGDVVEVDAEGYFYIVDRARDMFISGGENVYPAEIERVLCDHPDVRAAAVIGVPDPKWGEVGRAYVELRRTPGSAGDAELPHVLGELAGFSRERLANYKVPREFCAVAELPRNASGKVQKHLLAALSPEGHWTARPLVAKREES